MLKLNKVTIPNDVVLAPVLKFMAHYCRINLTENEDGSLTIGFDDKTEFMQEVRNHLKEGKNAVARQEQHFAYQILNDALSA